MIELSITRTSKSFNSSENYRIFDNETKRFDTLKEAKDFLKGEYGTSKRTKIYVDTRSGESKHIGYTYHFNNRDWSHDGESWRQQDWVEFSKVTYSRITL